MTTFTKKSIATTFSLGLLSIGTIAAAGLEAKKKFYSDDPIWSAPRPVAVKNVASRKLSDYYDFLSNTFFPAGERSSHGKPLPSQAINTVDEAMDSAWYTNRHAARKMSLDDLKAGPGNTTPPASGQWTVIAAKNEGVTPGFRIQDSAGRQYLLKFDPLSNPEMASAADVISSKFFYALGYNVPENYIVSFDRAQISIGEESAMKDASGRKRAIRESDIDEMLAKAPRQSDGRYRAMASRLIDGKPLGPFQYHGTRSDDPNDLVDHENRRDLRGLRTFAAWLDHDDSRAINTLDMLTEEDGTPFVKHYLIDFGATLGSASYRAASVREGNVYLFDWKNSAAQAFTLGLYTPAWQRAKYPNLPSVGKFEYEVFDPTRWVPGYPNSAFHNENASDRLWAARKIASFTEAEIRAIVSLGQYSDYVAEDWVARCIIGRQRKIVQAYLGGAASLDSFAINDSRLEWKQTGAKAAVEPVQIAWAAFDNNTGLRRLLAGANSRQVPEADTDYLVAELTGPSGPAISVYVRRNADRAWVVGVERHFPPASAN